MEQLAPLIRQFETHARPEKVEWMENYLKGHFSFLGLETKVRRDIQRKFFKEICYPDKKFLFDYVFYLWNLPYREYQYTAIELIKRFEKKLEKNDIVHIEKLIVTKSWWDSVDGLAAWTCGAYFKLFPGQIKSVTTKWMQSGNFWLQRSCLLFQLSYKKSTDTELLESFIGRLCNEKEFFIRKAIGWILREYSKSNPEWVRELVGRQKLSPLSYKEATKYI